MKKLFSIVLIAVAFTLVGCSSEKGTSTIPNDTFPQQKEKCHGKKCHHHHGKLGVEKITEDTAK